MDGHFVRCVVVMRFKMVDDMYSGATYTNFLSRKLNDTKSSSLQIGCLGFRICVMSVVVVVTFNMEDDADCGMKGVGFCVV